MGSLHGLFWNESLLHTYKKGAINHHLYSPVVTNFKISIRILTTVEHSQLEGIVSISDELSTVMTWKWGIMSARDILTIEILKR